MAALEMPANGEAGHNVGEDIIHKALDSVEDQLQKVSLPAVSSDSDRSEMFFEPCYILTVLLNNNNNNQGLR